MPGLLLLLPIFSNCSRIYFEIDAGLLFAQEYIALYFYTIAGLNIEMHHYTTETTRWRNGRS